MGRINTEVILERFKKVHGDRYDYSLVEYKGSSAKVKIICKTHGVFEQTPTCHTRPRGCPECAKESRRNHFAKTKEEFIRDSIKKHGNLYDYSLIDYFNSHTKVTIICPSHGQFEQSPTSHMQGSGCPKCAGKNRSIEDFIRESNSVHGYKYDYSRSVLNGFSNETTIICRKHGEFRQTPTYHLSGRGCYFCGIESTAKHRAENPTGWRITCWQKAGERSKNFDSFKVYVIKCWNDEEEFYKIGRTYVKTNIRFRNKTLMPYNYEIIKEIIFDNGAGAFDKETELKRLNKEFKYLPKIEFGGMHECFSEIKSLK